MKTWKSKKKVTLYSAVTLLLLSTILLTACASAGNGTPTVPPGLATRAAGFETPVPGAGTSIATGAAGAGTSAATAFDNSPTSIAGTAGIPATGGGTATNIAAGAQPTNIVTENVTVATSTAAALSSSTPTIVGGIPTNTPPPTSTSLSSSGLATPTIIGLNGSPTPSETPTPTPTGETPTPQPSAIIPSVGSSTPNATPSAQINITGSPNYQGFNNINQQREAAGLGILNRRANLQAAVNSRNASQLKPGWQVNTHAMVTGMPLVENGKVFFGDWAGFVYAADATTGNILWQKQVEQPNSQWPWHGFAATGAVGDQYVYFGSVEGTMYALDKSNGNIAWQTKLDNNQYAGDLGKPMFYNGKLFVGLASVEEPLSHKNPNIKMDFQGKVMALDAQSGKVLWNTSLVDAPGNGVAVWGSFAIDPATNMLFFGTGNNYSGEATRHSDSVMAVDANTGKIKWSTQVTSQDIWLPIKAVGPDYDFGAGPQLFNATINGQTRQLIGIGQKSGYYWAFDRNTGKPVWKTFIGYAGVAGGIRGEAGYAQGYLFIWSNNNFTDNTDPTKALITVKALDAATGKNVWSVENAQPAIGWAAGFLSNDVFFVGSLDGTVKGYRASDGKVVFSTKVPAPVGAPLVVVGNTLFVGGGVPQENGGANSNSGVFTYSLGQGTAQSQTPAASQTVMPGASVGAGSPTPNLGLGLTPSAIASQAPVQDLTVFPTATP